MLLYKESMAMNRRERPSTVITLDNEKLERPVPTFNKPKDKLKFINDIEKIIRKSDEYREHIKFLKRNMDMDRCAVLRGLSNTNGRRYRIEIHHEPFTLFDIVQAVVNKFEALGLPMNKYKIADEVEELHYDGKIGLVPLSLTAHQLVHNGKVFVPLQNIYHAYDKFYAEYEPFIDEKVKEKLNLKVELSLKCESDQDILSDVLDTNFVYIEVEGVKMPEVPDEWQNVLSDNQYKPQ